jgi:Topoisomerase 6 subunit A/Spo11, Toprim domain
MSTKGMSVTASRLLVEDLCGRHGIPLLVLHDFDKSGFSIIATLQQDTRRYSFRRQFEVIDLGLRLADIDGLESEDVSYQQSDESLAANLQANGATKEEIDFLRTSRVELNAMASDEFVAFIERRLAEVGVKKVIPDAATLEAACRRVRLRQAIDSKIAAFEEEARAEAAAMATPADLSSRVAAMLEEEPELAWDDAVDRIIAEHDEEEESGRLRVYFELAQTTWQDSGFYKLPTPKCRSTSRRRSPQRRRRARCRTCPRACGERADTRRGNLETNSGGLWQPRAK